MQAKDVMTVNVITTGPDATVEEIAELLLARGISGLPVVDGDGRLLGLVSEGDLVHRQSADDAEPSRRSWWLRFLTSNAEKEARDSIKRHGHRAQDVMTQRVITVDETTPLGEIASLLERHRIKRVPVMRDGRIVGIVSRANLLQGLATKKDELPTEAAPRDAAIRDEVLKLLDEGWVSHGALNVTVTAGKVELWGWVESAEEARAIEIAAADVPGVTSVEPHLARYPHGS